MVISEKGRKSFSFQRGDEHYGRDSLSRINRHVKSGVLTFSFHADQHTLLQTTILTSVTLMLVDHAVLAASAHIAQSLPDASLEKAFTPSELKGLCHD